jgi:hypothetical protein
MNIEQDRFTRIAARCIGLRMIGKLLKVNDLVAREGVEPPTPAFSGATEALLTVNYKDVEGCETPVTTRNDRGFRARTTGWFLVREGLPASAQNRCLRTHFGHIRNAVSERRSRSSRLAPLIACTVMP